jgi:sugar phosphate isomerase/epimerase
MATGGARAQAGAVTGPGDLIASYYTLTGTPVGQPPRFSFDERVGAAARAGFAGIGLLVDDYAVLRSSGHRDADLLDVLDRHGVSVMEVEFLFDWALDGPRAEAARAAEATAHAMVDVFAPHHVNVGDLQAPGELAPLDVVAERFAGVCDRAAEHGTRVALEFLPWTGLADLATAAEVVHAAGRANGGILIDAWHYFRGDPDPSTLQQLRPRDVVAVQLDDADAEPVGPLFEDTMFRRRLPGEGSFDLVGLVQALDTIGVDGPYSVEIMSTVEQSHPVEAAARRAHDAAASVLARARARPA